MKQNESIKEDLGTMSLVAQDEPYKSGAIQYIESREVAEIVEKNHKDLMRDIRRYCKQIEEINESSEPQRNLALSDFFMESSYLDAQGQERPCYFVTKKGCEFIAHKLTGIKGTKFTATYINRFHEMEDRLQTAPIEITDGILEQMAGKVAEKLMERAQGSDFGNEDRGVFRGINRYDSTDQYTIEIRKKELYTVTMKVAEIFGETHTSILHQMYKVLEQKFDIVLDTYKAVYRSETGRQNAGMIEVISANDRIYEAAISMNEHVIREKQIYS